MLVHFYHENLLDQLGYKNCFEAKHYLTLFDSKHTNQHMHIIHCNTTPQSRFHGFLKVHMHISKLVGKNSKATDCDLTEGDHRQLPTPP